MPVLDISDAESIAGRHRPWTIRMEFTGPNPANTSGSSSKYWYATGRSIHEKVEIGWGAIGSAPQHQLIDWPELRIRVSDKQSSGYKWCNTPYIRMSPGGIASVTGVPQVVTQPLKPPKPIVTKASGKVTVLVIARSGTVVTGYKALDANGLEIEQMTPTDGLAYAQEHNIDIRFV